jgi:heme/copper-type cytochrome/quinol oxidase subunit 4
MTFLATRTYLISFILVELLHLVAVRIVCGSRVLPRVRIWTMSFNLWIEECLLSGR